MQPSTERPPERSAVEIGFVTTLAIGACSVALFAPLLLPLLTGRVFVYNDLSWFHLPVRFLYQQALRAGDSVLWTPSIFAGFHLHGEGQGGFFHPFHQLLYRLLPLGAAFNIEVVASYPAAFAGTWWLLRRLALSLPAALFGAMLFAFGGFNLLHHHHVNMVAIVAHMPWLLGAADVLIVESRRRFRMLSFAGIALILGSEVLIGFPQGVWWNGLALASFAAVRAGETGRWMRLIACGFAAGIGVLLGGIQLLPTLEAASLSTRMGLERDFALTYSLHPYNLFQLWSPYFFTRGAYSVADYMWFHDFGIYSGAVLLAGCIWVWMRRHQLRDRRALIVWATAFAAVSLVLALGRYGGLAVLLSYVPGLQSLRAPARYIVLVQFALTILAAIAMDDLIAIAQGRRAPAAGSMRALWLPTGLGVFTMLGLNSGLLGYGGRTFSTAAAAAPGVAIAAGTAGLVMLAGRGRRWAVPVLVVVVAGDLAAWGVRFVYREPAKTIEQVTRDIAPPPPDPSASYAAAPERGPYRHDVLVLRGYRLTTGYVGLFPETYYPLHSGTALRLAGTRWSFAADGTRNAVEGSEPRARLLEHQGGPGSGTARLVIDRPGYLVAEIQASGPRILALTERFHPGWSARADGRPLRVIRVNEDFLGCEVDAEVRNVTFRFMPRSFVRGAYVTLGGVLLLAGVLALWPK